MLERFGRDARATVRRAQSRARAEGAISLEAQHLLLALTEVPSGRAGRVIVSLGLTQETVRQALDREMARALAAAGVHETPPVRRIPPTLGRGFPRWGQSAKLALKRTLEEALRRGDRTMGNEHLLLAIVSAEAGVIPRVLEEIQITPAQVRAGVGLTDRLTKSRRTPLS